MPASLDWSMLSSARSQVVADHIAQLLHQLAGLLGLLVQCQPHAQAELGVILE